MWIGAGTILDQIGRKIRLPDACCCSVAEGNVNTMQYSLVQILLSLQVGYQ